MSTRLTIARDALDNLDENASMISIALGRKMVEAGINPVAVEAIAAHFPVGGPNKDGWRWAFETLVAAGAADGDSYYDDAARAGYYLLEEE